MKKYFSLIFFLFLSSFLFAQVAGPKEITPDMLQKIKTEVERKVPAFKKELQKKDWNDDEIEFALDTFRIEQIVAKRIDIDYSTAGMDRAVSDLTNEYDVLLNKYYKKLLALMNGTDKNVLVNAQRAWIKYRDTEGEFISTVSKDEYSGGGTIQTLVVTGNYSELVIKRTCEIFNYYNKVKHPM